MPEIKYRCLFCCGIFQFLLAVSLLCCGIVAFITSTYLRLASHGIWAGVLLMILSGLAIKAACTDVEVMC